MKRLALAVAVTQPISWIAGLSKSEATIWLAQNIDDPFVLRGYAYALAAVLTAILAPLSAWIAYKVQAKNDLHPAGDSGVPAAQLCPACAGREARG